MRAHVEVDDMVFTTCLDAAIELKKKFHGICDIMISGGVTGSTGLFDMLS